MKWSYFIAFQEADLNLNLNLDSARLSALPVWIYGGRAITLSHLETSFCSAVFPFICHKDNICPVERKLSSTFVCFSRIRIQLSELFGINFSRSYSSTSIVA